MCVTAERPNPLSGCSLRRCFLRFLRSLLPLCSPPPETVASCNSPLSLSGIPTTRTHLVRERLVSPWETVGPRFDSQKTRVSGAGARWPAGVLPLVSFDVGGAFFVECVLQRRGQIPLVVVRVPAWALVLSMTIKCFSGTFPEVPGSAPSGACPF